MLTVAPQWSIAIAFQYYKEKRLLRVAPDPKSLDRTDDDAEDAQLRIISDIHRRPRLVPSLLHVCQYTRNEASKGYELWGCADPITYEKNNSKVYVKVDIDAFFFGDADLVSEQQPQTLRINSILAVSKLEYFVLPSVLTEIG